VKAMQRNVAMMRVLHESENPVPEIIQLPDGRDYVELEDRGYVLTTKLRGRNVVQLMEYNDPWFFELGAVVARLHIAFQKCENKISYWNNSLLEEMQGWVSRDLKKFQPEYLKQADMTEAIDELARNYNMLPRQLIHRDVHLGNFLFDQGVFSGYIDFDLIQSNIRIFDMCYLLLGILLEEDNNRVDESKWYDIIREVIRGYDSLISLNSVEKDSIACVMKNIELLFVAYFLGIGDEKLAKDAAELFQFVKRNEGKIVQPWGFY